MKTTNRSVIFLLIFTFLACREKAPNLTLPAITQTGKNTLGFLLNNQVWANYGKRCTIAGCNPNEVRAFLYKEPNGKFELEISADYTSNKTDQSFFISTTDITEVGTFYLDRSFERNMTFIASRYNQSYKEYVNEFPNSCILTITKLDTVNKIIAGTFSGVIYDPLNPNDSIRVQDGRFDVQLDYQR